MLAKPLVPFQRMQVRLAGTTHEDGDGALVDRMRPAAGTRTLGNWNAPPFAA